MIAHRQADILMWIGALGVLEFGTLLFAVRHTDTSLVGQNRRQRLGTVLGRAGGQRIDRWIRIAPSMTAISVVLLLAGATLRWLITR